MAWYDVGTVSVTNGSTTVTGSGTDFISGAQVGEAFLAPDDKLYEIASITSATVLVLADNYLGSTQSGQDYKIVPTQSLVADLASDVTDLIADYADVKDKAGAGKFNDGSVTSPAITFEQDQNNGLYRIGSDNWGLVAGGEKIVDVSTNGIKLDDNNKATFGTGDDLQIYHDGSNSFIADTGTGNLSVRGTHLYLEDGSGSETYAKFFLNAQAELYHDNSKKLATTSTGVDVTGTVTSDGLTVESGAPVFTIHNTLTSQFENNLIGKIDFEGSDASSNSSGVRASIQATVNNTQGATSLDLYSRDIGSNPLTKGLTVASNNDVHFYEDTGTTAKMVWDASAESLGIGTSPEAKLHVEDGDILIERTVSTGADLTFKNNAADQFTADRNYHQVNFITASGASETTGGYARIKAGQENSGTNNSTYIGLWTAPNNGTVTERMRIDSSGNLLVGKTTNSIDTVGGLLRANGQIGGCASNSYAGVLARNGTDGDIALFRKDGSTVGSIGTNANALYILGDTTSGNAAGLKFIDGSSERIVPATSGGADADNLVDLGQSGARFKDLYLSGGLYLGGTGSANKLDDYETGSFTATLTPETSGSVSLLSTVDNMQYIKVGQKVTIVGRLRVGSVSSPVGSYIRINLPFTVANYTEDGGTAGSCSIYSSDGSTSWNAMPVRATDGETEASCYLPVSSINSNYRFEFSYTYFSNS